MSLEGAAHGLGAGGLLRTGAERPCIVGLLENALSQKRDARRPGRPFVARALRAHLRAERDQLAHVGDRLDRPRRGQAD